MKSRGYDRIVAHFSSMSPEKSDVSLLVSKDGTRLAQFNTYDISFDPARSLETIAVASSLGTILEKSSKVPTFTAVHFAVMMRFSATKVTNSRCPLSSPSAIRPGIAVNVNGSVLSQFPSWLQP
ncbi:MAG TPA: hypothetical protein VK638_39565 [Edaphobacter sp.]|nr:hypothetical protein [Edaphobacter sp.]